MNRFFRTPLVLAAVAMLTGGCATIQQANENHALAAQAKAAAAQAQQAADAAASKADAAQARAEQALRAAQDAKSLAEKNRQRINRAFRKAVQK